MAPNTAPDLAVSDGGPTLRAVYDPDHHLRDDHPGWTVRMRRFTTSKRRGRVDWVTSSIWIDDRQKPAEYRSTLAHEIVHVERGEVPPHLTEKEEGICEEIASRRLLPLPLLLDAVAWSADVRELARVLEVDGPMMKMRLDTLDEWERSHLDAGLRGRELTFPKSP